jgi:hypothetical protein
MTYAVQKSTYTLASIIGTLPGDLAVSGAIVTCPGTLGATPNLVAWWKLNVAVPSTLSGSDSSGKGHSITFPEGIPTLPGTPITPSSHIQANSLLFDGTEDYGLINNPSDNSFSFGNGTTDKPFSISFWMYATSLTSDNSTLFYKGTLTSKEYSFHIQPDGDPYFYLYKDASGSSNTALLYSFATGHFSAGVWTHVVCTYDGTAASAAGTTNDNGMTIYKNGSALSLNRSTQAGYTAMSARESPLLVGIDGDESGAEFDGYLADFAVWDVELTSAQISWLYNATSTPFYKVTRNFNHRGSVASNTGSVNSYRQGINVSETKYVMAGLTPKLGPGSRYNVFFNGINVSSGIAFNDMIAVDAGTTGSVKQIGTYNLPGNTLLNGEPIYTRKTGVRFDSTFKRTEEPNFEIEQQNFGQAKAFKDDTPFEEMQRFDAKQYLTDDTGAMVYPYVGMNPGAMDPYQMDGIIEPMPIRDAISLNTPAFPFFARGVWGTLESDYAQDSDRTSILITSQINNVSSSFPPFEDGFEYFMGHNTKANLLLASFGIISASNPPFMPIVFPPNPGYISEITSSIIPWKDETTSDYYAIQLSGSEMVTAVTAMTGTNEGPSGMPEPIFINNIGRNIGIHGGGALLKRNHRSATAGFVYNNNTTLGTDSITFGGWKK